MPSGFDAMVRDFLTFTEFSGSAVYEGDRVRGRNRGTDFFYAYWCGKCPAGGLASRSDIRPEALRAYLPHGVLMDLREELGEYQAFRLRLRLMGTHVVEAYGKLTGRDVAEMPNTETVRRIYAIAELVREKRVPVLNSVGGYAREGQHMDAYALYMPLSDTGGATNRIFAAGDVRSAGIAD